MKIKSAASLRIPLWGLKIGLLVALPVAAGVTWNEVNVQAQDGPTLPRVVATRPAYSIDLALDYELLTLRGRQSVTVPVSASDPLADVSFFLFGNAAGVGGDDVRRKNLVVDSVKWNGQFLPFQSEGAVLKVKLPGAQNQTFTLEIDWHGVVPRSPAASGFDMMGALGADISGLFGMGAQSQPKTKNTDYGLFTYGNGMLSLGSFWYPQLAVRENGRWVDSQPEGLGDVAYAVMSDYSVNLSGLPAGVSVVAPGSGDGPVPGSGKARRFRAESVREFAIVMSEDFVEAHRDVPVEGGTVRLSAFSKREHAAKNARVLDIASRALQIFSRRFGAYPYREFKVVEAPMRSGAGGMEYSAMVGIASMLYGDMKSQLGGLMTSLDLPGAGELLQGLEQDAGLAADKPAPATASPAGRAPAAAKPPQRPAAPTELAANPMADMVSGMLGQQMEMFDSMFEATIAHEVAHQWWAIGVGSDSQRHPFVDEALTNWSSMLYFEERYGRATAEKMMDLHLKTSFSMGAALGGGDMPANLPTSAYKNNLQYGAVIYGKGGLFYDELRKVVGDSALFAALREYYPLYNGKLASPNALRAIIVRQSPAKRGQIDALYKRWVEEAHGQEDIGGGMGGALAGLDLGNLLGGLMGGGNLGLDN